MNNLFALRLSDNGPIYTETNLARFPVEPWNAASNIIFLILVIYWVRKTRLNYSQHPLIVCILPILLLGFVGGTVFHATRSHFIWLALDFLPILICALVAAIHLWRQVLGNLAYAVLTVVALFLGLRLTIGQLDLPIGTRITLGYSSLAFSLLLPALLHCAKAAWKNFSLLLATIISFALAIFFRYIDRGLGAQFLPMGTHFLWHIFGGLSVASLITYVYKDDLKLA